MFQLPGRKEGLPIILHFWPVQGIGKLKSDDFNNTGLDQLKVTGSKRISSEAPTISHASERKDLNISYSFRARLLKAITLD